jgi:hypothetical protein
VAPNLKLVAPTAGATVLKPSESTRPDPVRPLIEPDTEYNGKLLLSSWHAARVKRAAVAATRHNSFFMSYSLNLANTRTES